MTPLLLVVARILLSAQAIQTTPGTVAGQVRDGETYEPLVGAVVMLTDLNRATATDAGGRYVLRQVPAGPQHITVCFVGHAAHSLDALVPPDGQLEINVSLHPAPLLLPPVDVTAPPAVHGLDSRQAAFPDRESSGAELRDHPLLAEPDAFQALGGGEVVLMPESPSGVHVRGGASDQTAYLLDGIPVFSPYHTAGVFSAWNPDALSQLELKSSAPSLANSQTLSGAIEAMTRPPGNRLSAQGSLSTTQARLTVDGPLGLGGAGYMVSLRSGLHGVVPRKDEASYLKGRTGDLLATIEAPAFGGQIRLLGYQSSNDLNAAAVTDEGAPQEDPTIQDSRRNVFEWESQSLGAEWKRGFSGNVLRILGWSAASDAGSTWAAQAALLQMGAERRDEGLLASVDHRSGRTRTHAGIRLERSTTSYHVDSDSDSISSSELRARTPVATAFAQQVRPISRGMDLTLGASLAATQGDLHAGPRAQLRWDVSKQVTLSGSYSRAHQFAQSLRNAESVVGNVFPVDLYMGAGAPGVPVAWSDQGVVALDYRLSTGVRLGVQAYQRNSDGLLLVAPREGQPFATGGFAVGSGASRGVAVDAAMKAPRYDLVARYGLQDVRLEHGNADYVPDYGARHLLEGGVTLLPTATTTIRVNGTAALRRRTTIVTGGLEWEACNLLDQGCEFGGSPQYDGEGLGATPLPAYFRVDLGARKHWNVEVGGHNGTIALFGTITNLTGRGNVLTYARNPSTGELVEIEMRPLAPLVVGVDWQF
jgi:hypothetical protein